MMLSHNKIKEIRRLHQKKAREETSLFIVEGEKLVEEALNSGFKIIEVYRKEEIGEQVMERISSLSSPSPVLAVVQQHKFSEDELVAKVIQDFSFTKYFAVKNKPTFGKESFDNHSVAECTSIYLVLDGIKDPGNLGTIVRLADWFGVAGIFCSSQSVELYNPKTVQATMGAIFRMPVVYCNLPQTLEKIRNACNAPVYGTFLEGESILDKKHHLLGKGIIVMGSESFGISQQVAAHIAPANRLFIPSFNKQGVPVSIAPPAPISNTSFPSVQNKYAMKIKSPFCNSESLNVATATAVILSYFRLNSM